MKKDKNGEAEDKTAVSQQKKPYQKPAIIRKGFVTTRAGSPLQTNNEEPFDMLDYFLGKQKK